MKKSRIAAIGVTVGLSVAILGWGVVAGADEVMGIVAREGTARIVVQDQPDGDRSITVKKVVAPTDGFVVVHQSDGGMPGARIGYVAVEKGVSRDLKIKLDPDVPMTAELIAAVHVDRGRRGVLEFDMENLERSADRPFFVNGKEVAKSFKAAEFGVSTSMGEAEVVVNDQPLGATVVIAKASAPSAAFVVVHKQRPDGMPGERVGFAAIREGTVSNVTVTLTRKLSGRNRLIAAIHVDADADGRLEFDAEDPVASPDQPFFADGMEVAEKFVVGPFGVKTDDASIEATDQIGVEGRLIVAEVNSPDDAWVVVHKEVDGAPGERVGLAAVKAGLTTDLQVPLSTDMLSENVIVALHADLGDSEVFEFDMGDRLGSADQPYFVDGNEVAAVVKVREFGYSTPFASAAILVEPQVVQDAFLKVRQAVAPEASWIVVHLDAGGMPGDRVGVMHIPAGKTSGAVVQLDASVELTDVLFVAVHADRGIPGMFEFAMADRVNSPDQPFFVDGEEVATGVSVR